MTTYIGGEAHPEVWRAIQEHRGRKELHKYVNPPVNPAQTKPTTKREKFPHN